MADIAAEPDHAVVDVAPFGTGEEAHEILFDVHGIGMGGEAQTVADAFDVGVHGQALVDAEGAEQHHIGRFAGHAGQGDELVQPGRHLAAIDGHHTLRRAQQVAGLAVIEARGADDAFQLLLRGQGQLGRAGPAPEQLRGHGIDAGVGTLGGQHRGHQEFPGVAGLKVGRGTGVAGLKGRQDFFGAGQGTARQGFFCAHEPAMPQEGRGGKAGHAWFLRPAGVSSVRFSHFPNRRTP